MSEKYVQKLTAIDTDTHNRLVCLLISNGVRLEHILPQIAELDELMVKYNIPLGFFELSTVINCRVDPRDAIKLFRK